MAVLVTVSFIAIKVVIWDLFVCPILIWLFASHCLDCQITIIIVDFGFCHGILSYDDQFPTMKSIKNDYCY